MKKLLFAVAALFTCLAAGAQTWIGGSLGFGLNGYGLTEGQNYAGNPREYPWNESEKVLSITPTIGYAYSENIDLGAQIGFSHFRNINGFRGKKYTQIEVAPFIRYTFWDNGARFEKGDITAFVQASVNFSTNNQPFDEPISYGTVNTFKTSERDRKAFGFGITPGIKYQMTETISLAATFGWLGWQKSVVKVKEFDGVQTAQRKTYTTSTFGVDLSSALNIGVYYSF